MVKILFLPGIEMNGISSNGKTRNFEKTHPGCLGRMVNLFELNIGVSADRLLTDKPHGDGAHSFYLKVLICYIISLLKSSVLMHVIYILRDHSICLK